MDYSKQSLRISCSISGLKLKHIVALVCGNCGVQVSSVAVDSVWKNLLRLRIVSGKL